MNPPQKKKYTKFKKKRQPADLLKYKKRITVIASLLLFVTALSVGLGIFLNWYFVDTKYDGKFRSSGLKIPALSEITVEKQYVDNTFEYQKKLLIRKNSTFTPVTEGVIAEGYNVTVNAIGRFVDENGEVGEEYSGSRLEKYEITDIGNHITSDGVRFLPEMQESLIGQSVAENTKVSVNIKYVDTYREEALRGKTVQFEITVVSVTKTNSPSYDDAFIKSHTEGFETVAEYEEALREAVSKELIWSAAVNAATVEKYPKKFVNQYKKEADDFYKAEMESKSLTFKTLLASLGFENEEEYNNALQEYAEGTVKEEMVLYKIAKDEKIRVSRDEYTAGLVQLYEEEEYTGSYDSFEKTYGKELIMRSVLWDKVKNHLYSLVRISE